jgi:hypothetical protein
MCEVVGWEEDIIEKDDDQDRQCVENVLARSTVSAGNVTRPIIHLLPLLLMRLSIFAASKVNLTVDRTNLYRQLAPGR